MKLTPLVLYCCHLLQIAERLNLNINWNRLLHCCTLHMLVPLIVEVHTVCHLLQGLLEVVLHDHLTLCHLCHLCIRTLLLLSRRLQSRGATTVRQEAQRTVRKQEKHKHLTRRIDKSLLQKWLACDACWCFC